MADVDKPDNNNRQFARQKTFFAILHILNSVIGERRYPDMLIGDFFKKEKFSSAEKANIAEIVYGILRHRGRIDYIIENASNAVISGLDLNITNILRICSYQALFTNTSPAGIINNAVALSFSYDKGRFSGFVKRTVESIIRSKERVSFPDKEKDLTGYISTYHSHPRWIVEKWLAEFHEPGTVESLCHANNLPPPLAIRVNLLKINLESLQKSLKDEGYVATPAAFSPFCLVVDKKDGIFRTKTFGNGYFEVQDEGSQLITLLTGVLPGECVIDACAGNGGKSLFISGLMKNQGIVYAFDTHSGKLSNLRRRANRAGASNIHAVPLDKFKLQQLEGSADCVLIDAPCSGMGIFRRNPDSKWRLAQEDISELSIKQKEIIREYSKLVKPGGRVVYATCTVSRVENEEVVLGFLEEKKEFHLIPVSEVKPSLFSKFTTPDGFFRSLPHIHNTDGFFGAVIKKF